MALQPNPYQDFHSDCVQNIKEWSAQLPESLRWLNSERAQGLDYFAVADLPTRKTENWKYTPITAITQSNILQLNDNMSVRDDDMLAGDFHQVNIINGHVVTDQLPAPDSELSQEKAVDVIPFTTTDPEHQQLIRAHLNKTFDHTNHPFATWNSSFLQDGLLIRVRDNLKLTKPICVNHISNGNEQSFSSHTRVLILLEPGSGATIIENFTDLQSPHKTMNNALCEVHMKTGSQLTHCAINAESENHIHTGALFVEQHADSQLTQHSFATGGTLKRRDIQVKLLGTQADCKMFGAYLIGDKSHIDYHTTIEHVAPHCTSEENFKGIVTDQGKAVFNGRIHIHPDAQQSNAQMNNKNLLLTNTAEVNTKPELEIYADDVKCAHGATVGQLDESALYYFQTRGISKADANRMLSHAFIEIIISKMNIDSVRNHVESITRKFFDR